MEKIIKRHPTFDKHYQKRILPNPALDRKFQERVKIFISDPNNPVLKVHSLIGEKVGLRSFSITGNIRVIYKTVSPYEVTFLDIGTHNQVY